MNFRFPSLTKLVFTLVVTCSVDAAYSVDTIFAEEPAERPPNLVLIFTDDQGYGDLACYGATDLRTPNIDRLATEGMKLTDFHVQASVCSPSRAALLTGCYPKRTGVSAVLVPKHKSGLRFDRLTLAEILKPVGYATMCVGKWHLGHTPGKFPTERGFDEYFGIPYSNDMGAMRGTGVVDPSRDKPPLPLMRASAILETEPDQAQLTRRYTEAAVEFIRKKKNQPFFLYFPHTFPHRPTFASKQFLGKSQRGIYGDMIEEIDWSVGEILKTLDELELVGDTLVVFTSDNGHAPISGLVAGTVGGSAGPLRGHKFQVYEGGHRVPCLMRLPGRIPAGSICDTLLTAMDVVPTMSALAGAVMPPAYQVNGHDIRPIIFGQTKSDSPYDLLYHFAGNRLGAIRSGPWKMIMPKGGKNKKPMELYHLEDDIGETKDLVAQYPEIVKKMQAYADRTKDALRLGEVDAQQKKAESVKK